MIRPVGAGLALRSRVGPLQDTERDALLDLLAGFVRADPSPFYRGFIALPNETCFPDPFTRTADGVARIASHLLVYARFEDGYGVDVTLGEGAASSKAMLPETRVDFACIEEGQVFLSCTALGRADDALFATTQEIARAAMFERRARRGGAPYREALAKLQLTPTDTDDEKREASVYAMYVGLGVIATAGAHQYRQAERVRSRQPVTEWAHVSHGALSPAEASFLLAVQLVTRAIDGERREALLACLPEDRRGEVLAELEALEREALITRLGLPPVSEWEPEETLTPAEVMPAAESEDDDDDDDIGAREPETAVFRVRRASTALGATLGALGALFFGIFVRTMFFATDDATLFLFAVVLVGAVFGAMLGGQVAVDECSDCARAIPEVATRCPSCKHAIGGRIAHRSLRLDARAALARRSTPS